MNQNAIGVLVKLLDLFTLHVGLAGEAEHIDKSGLVDLAVDDFRGEHDLVEEPRELAGGTGDALLMQKQMLSDGNLLGHGISLVSR